MATKRASLMADTRAWSHRSIAGRCNVPGWSISWSRMSPSPSSSAWQLHLEARLENRKLEEKDLRAWYWCFRACSLWMNRYNRPSGAENPTRGRQSTPIDQGSLLPALSAEAFPSPRRPDFSEETAAQSRPGASRTSNPLSGRPMVSQRLTSPNGPKCPRQKHDFLPEVPKGDDGRQVCSRRTEPAGRSGALRAPLRRPSRPWPGEFPKVNR